ncbi:unnamed protein product, partial [Ascophyllum nodosum]
LRSFFLFADSLDLRPRRRSTPDQSLLSLLYPIPLAGGGGEVNRVCVYVCA